jgi:hypothetical protein
MPDFDARCRAPLFHQTLSHALKGHGMRNISSDVALIPQDQREVNK